MLGDSKTSMLLDRPFLTISKALIDVEIGELIFIFEKQKIMFNVFEAMKHKKENLQCYSVDVIKDVIEEVSQSESTLLHIEYIMVNSIDTIEEGQDKEF